MMPHAASSPLKKKLEKILTNYDRTAAGAEADQNPTDFTPNFSHRTNANT
jgi:hypothetical protein